MKARGGVPKSSIKGLYYRLNGDRPIGWWFRWREGKRRRHEKMGEPQDQRGAERRALEILARLADDKVGLPVKAQEQQRLTVEELGQKFLEGYSRPRIKDLDAYQAKARTVLARQIVPVLGPRRADEIRTTHVEDLRDELRESGYAPNTINAALVVLSRIFTWAHSRSLVTCPNPCVGVERFEVIESLDFLEREQLERLLGYAADLAERPGATFQEQQLHPMIAVGVYAGLRKGELFGLRWRDVHLEERRIDVARSYRLAPKSGKPREVWFSPELVPILRAWQPRCLPTDEDLVFPVLARGELRMGDSGDILGLDQLLLKVRTAAVAHPWHLLRHSYATHLAATCKDPLIVQRMLGHSSLRMTQKYMKPIAGHIAEQTARLSFSPRVPATVTPIHSPRARRAG